MLLPKARGHMPDVAASWDPVSIKAVTADACAPGIPDAHAPTSLFQSSPVPLS